MNENNNNPVHIVDEAAPPVADQAPPAQPIFDPIELLNNNIDGNVVMKIHKYILEDTKDRSAVCLAFFKACVAQDCLLDKALALIGWIASRKFMTRGQVLSSGIIPFMHETIDSQSNDLSQLRVEFLQVCLAAGVCIMPLSEWPTITSNVDLVTVLRYFYLRGVMHMNAGEYKLALRCWKQCLGSEGAIVSEARKKYILLQCLVGEYTKSNNNSSNKSTAPKKVRKSTTHLSIKYYFDLAAYFTQTSSGATNNSTDTDNKISIADFVTKHATVWEKDGNTGLVQQVLREGWPRKVLRDFSRLYASSTLSELAAFFQQNNYTNLCATIQRVSLADNWPIIVQDQRVYFGEQQSAEAVDWDEYIKVTRRVERLRGEVDNTA